MGTKEWLLTSGGALLLLYVAAVAALIATGRRSDARALARFVPDCIVLFRRLLADGRVPRRNKILLGLMVGYLAMPLDLVPDFIPVAGQLDDAILVMLVLRSLVRAAGAGPIKEHWPGPEKSLQLLLGIAGARA